MAGAQTTTVRTLWSGVKMITGERMSMKLKKMRSKMIWKLLKRDSNAESYVDLILTGLGNHEL